MIPNKILEAYAQLQQLALDIEDTSALLNLFLPKALDSLAANKIQFQFICTSFFNDSNQLVESLLVDKNYAQGIHINFDQVINIPVLLKKIPEWKTQSKQEEIIMDLGINELIEQTYPSFAQLKSVIIEGLYIGKKLTGFLLLGSDKTAYSPEENVIIRILSHTIASNYRLQDTQQSLTKITQEVYKMNAQLHQLDKLKDDFVSVASHELRTPMAAIRSYTWMAINRSDMPLSDKLKKYLNRILISTERLINLVNDMLNISRIESGRIQIDPKVFNISELLDDVYQEVDAKAKEKNVHLEVVKDNVPQVFADPDKVHQVLLNLIGNSLKFTPVDGKITVAFFSDGHNVEISVKDTGVGIAKEDISRLFQKFGRLDNSYVAMGTSGGTGLGLFICKSLVELMKGKITAVSEGIGKGSTFTFSLPVATQEVLAQADKYRYNPGGDVKGLEPVAI